MNIDGAFNPENKFWSFMNKIMDLCTISLIWFLFSIPIVTAGAATTALFQFTLRMTANEEGYVWKSFWKAFKSDFLQATVLWVSGGAMGLFLTADLYFLQFLPFPQWGRWLLMVVFLCFLIVYLLTMMWVFPLLSFFHVGIKQAVKHSFVMAVGNLYVSVTILVIYGIAGVLTWFVPWVFMVWFAIATYAASHFYRMVLLKYVKDDKEDC